MNSLQLLKYGLSLTIDGYKQLAFINRFLKPLVNTHCRRLGYQLSAPEKKKILFYYPMFTVLACAQMYVTLKGRRLTKDETKRLTLVAAMATLCDDLIDEENWSRGQIFHLLSSNLNEDGLITKAKLLVSLNNELKLFWPLSEKYLKQLKIALEWQAKSGRQLDPNITLEEIVQICRKKNGHTSLMFATLVNEDWDDQELKFIYQSAMVGQLTNDSFDMYFDSQNGIRTYFNTTSSIQQARQFFINECRILHATIIKCNNSRQNKLNTIRRMSLLHGFTLTALDQFEELEKKYGAPVNWKTLPRKDVVIDMALNKKRFKTLKNIKWLAEQY
jgi:hypothetical protein